MCRTRKKRSKRLSIKHRTCRIQKGSGRKGREAKAEHSSTGVSLEADNRLEYGQQANGLKYNKR
jgi:hypothetical protein